MCMISIMDNFGNKIPTNGGIPFTENDGQERQNRKLFYTRPKTHLTVLNEREENEYNLQAQQRPVLQPTHNELRLPPLKTAIPFRMSEHPNGTLNSGVNNPHQKSAVAYVPETWTPENVARVKQEQLIAFNKTKDKNTFLEKMSSRIRGTKIKRAATAITECAQYSYPKRSAIANICNNGISQNREQSGKQSLVLGETFRLPKICTNESRQTNSVANSHLHGSGNHNKISPSNKVTKLPLLEDKTCNKYSNGANVGQASNQFIDSVYRRPDTPAPHSRNAGIISNNFLHPRGGFKDNLREMMAVRKSDNLRGTNKSDTRAVSSARKPKNAPWTELNKKSLEINLVETVQDYGIISNKEKFRSEHQIAEDCHQNFSDTITKFPRFSSKLRKNLNAMTPKIALPLILNPLNSKMKY